MSIASSARVFWHRLADEVGLRFLARRRAAFAVAVITMALALGANTAVFSVVRALLLSSLGVPEPDRVLAIAPARVLPGRGSVNFNDAWPNYELFRSVQRSFLDVTCLRTATASWDDQGEARPLQMTYATASFFRTMAVAPSIGRPFTTDEDGPSSPAPVVVISHALWQSAFLADPAAVGRTMRINGAPLSIIGVMPEGFAQPSPTDIWVPFVLPAAARTSISGARQMNIYGRIASGVSRRAVESEVHAFTARAIQFSPDNRDFSYGVQTLRQALLDGGDNTVLLVQGGALALLLLAILNLGALLVAWGFERRPELGVRVALGASAARVARMLVAQAIVVASTGAVGGFILAAGAVRWLATLDAGPTLAPFMASMRVDQAVLGTEVVAAILIGLLAGIAPASFVLRSELAATIRASTRSVSHSRGALRVQKAMVVAQAMLSVLILAAAALVGASFRNLMQVPDGFDPAGKVVVRLQLADDTYGTHEARAAFATTLHDNLSREAELVSYGFTTTLPVGDFQWAGRFVTQLPDGSMMKDPMVLHLRRVSSGYTTALGLPLLQGRLFDAHDDSTRGRVALISHMLAARLWPKGDAIGKFLYRAVPGQPQMPIEVVGVVGDAMDGGYSAPAGDAVYLPYLQLSAQPMSIVARWRSSPTAAIASIRHALKRTDPVLAANRFGALDALVTQANLLPRLQSVLLLVFALVALAIAGLGSYGVMNQLVANREREFGVRLVFGAAPASNGRRVLWQIATLTLPGVLAGLVLTWSLAGVLQPFMFSVSPRSLPVLLGVGVGIAILEVVAALPSVRRAMRIDVRQTIQ